MSPVVACMVIASLAGLWGHPFANRGGVEAGSLELIDMAGGSLALVKPRSQFTMSVGVANTGDALS